MASLTDFLEQSQRRLFVNASPTFMDFAKPQKPRVDIASLSRSQELKLAGAPDAEIEEARTMGITTGETGLLKRRALLEDFVEDGEFAGKLTQPKGVLESVADVFQRGVSAVVGGTSALLDLERKRETAGDGSLFETAEGRRQGEGRSDFVLRRFAEGLSGEEMYRFADFGVLAYDRETASFPERAMKATAGFLLDTVVDPLTYMSLGGSIFGRAQGARRVYHSLSNKKSRDNLTAAVNLLNLDDQVELIMRNTGQFTMTKGTLVKQLSDRVPDIDRAAKKTFDDWGVTASDDMLRRFLRTQPAIVKDFAADFVAGQGANAYSVGSSAGLRRYLHGEFGKEAGNVLYKTLPLDLQGGVRMRVPFSSMGGRDPKMLFKVPGTEKLSSVSNHARQFLRTRMPFTRSVEIGKLGAAERNLRSAYYQSVNESSSKFFGRIDVDTNAISWFDVEALRNMQRLERQSSATTRAVIDMWSKGNDHKLKAIKLISDTTGDEKSATNAFYNTLDRVMSENITMSKGSRQKVSAEEIFGKNMNKADLEIYETAMSFREVSDLVAAELEEMFDGRLGVLFKRLQADGEYWPRIVDEMNAISSRGRKTSKPLYRRESWFSAYNEKGNAIASMTPLQIGRSLGVDDGGLFVIDPAEAMATYIVATRKIVMQENLLRAADGSGLLLRGTKQEIPDIGKARETAQDWYRNLQVRQRKLKRQDTVNTREDAQQVFETLEGLDFFEEKLLFDYTEALLEPDALPNEIFYRAMDGYGAYSANPASRMWYARDAKGQYLTTSNTWTENITEANVFVDRLQAQGAIDSIEPIANARVNRYVEFAQEAKRDALAIIGETTLAFDNLDIFGKQSIYNPNGSLNMLNPVNLPPAKQESYIASIVDLLYEVTSVIDDFPFRRDAVVGQSYKLSGAGLGGYKQLSDVGDVQVIERMQSRFEELGLFAPDLLVEPIQRFFEAYIRPETKWNKFVDDFYRPFYAMQKSLMTAQRGPGYVFRNIQGGVWNAWLVGVRATDFADSAKVNIARIKSFSSAKRIIEDANVPGYVTEFERSALIMQEFQKELTSSFGDKRGRQMFEYWNTYDQLNIGGSTKAGRQIGLTSVARAGEPDIALQRIVNAEDIGWFKNTTDWLASRNVWAQRMGGFAQESEDYLRFATFIKGARSYGTEDGGLAASLYVKASQFDYDDLSEIEINVLKMIIPFYTWSRNNIPLQVRAAISQPGKVNQALRINEAFAGVFGEADEPEEPLPAYVRERMGWKIRTDLITGPAGDALAGGLLVGEPLLDINRLYRFGTGSQLSNINWREVANNLNPAISAGAEFVTGIEQSSGGRYAPTEETPQWLLTIRQGLGIARKEDEVSSRWLQISRGMIPPLSLAERLAPQILGNERLQRRWFSTLASNAFGLPVSTLDPYVSASEFRAEEARNRKILEKDFGKNYTEYTEFARGLLILDITPFEMNMLRKNMFNDKDFKDVSVEQLDGWMARDYLDIFRRLHVLRQSGLDEDRLNSMWQNFRPRTDIQMGARFGSPQPIPPEILKDVGLTPQEVANMTRNERQRLINRYFNQA